MTAYMGVGRIFSRGGTRGFFQNSSREAKSSEICFSPLKTKKTTFFAKHFKIQAGLPRLPTPTTTYRTNYHHDLSLEPVLSIHCLMVALVVGEGV